MRVGYTVFPRSGYILETLRGIVTYQDLIGFVTRQHVDARIKPQYHTVSDFSRATARLTEDEVRQYADAMCAPPSGRLGHRALVVLGARNLAFASMLQSSILQYGLEGQCFCDRDAALRWLEGQSLEGQSRKEKSLGRSSLEPASANSDQLESMEFEAALS